MARDSSGSMMGAVNGASAVGASAPTRITDKTLRQLVAATPPEKPRKARNAQPEAWEQGQVVGWARNRFAEAPERWPHLGRLFCSLAGVPMTTRQAARAKQQGNRAGVFDLILPVPRGRFFGLFIEMKSEKGKASQEQLDEQRILRSLGYMAEICKGHQAAIQVIRDYYAQGEPQHGIQSPA